MNKDANYKVYLETNYDSVVEVVRMYEIYGTTATSLEYYYCKHLLAVTPLHL
jgi:hypothetical protein